MNVTRFDDAEPYVAPNHRDVRSLRLQGFGAKGPETFWTGLSHVLPGGGAGPDASPLEKVYVVLTGELTVIVGHQEVVLRALDSCCIPGNETREVKNNSNSVASMLVVMPYPASKP
jgi:quercetin dioxygenase-like cupin family protein